MQEIEPGNAEEKEKKLSRYPKNFKKFKGFGLNGPANTEMSEAA